MFGAICIPVGAPHDDERKVLAKSGQEVSFGALAILLRAMSEHALLVPLRSTQVDSVLFEVEPIPIVSNG